MPHCPVTVVQRYRDGVCSLLFHLFFIICHPYIPLHLEEMIFYTCRTVSHLLYFHIAAHSIASRRKSAKADPAETETAPSNIPLSFPVQQSSVRQESQLQSPSSTESEETVVYTGEACSHISQNGISFHFPASESKCRV